MTPVIRNNQTFTISDSMSLTHGKHSFTWGGDFRRIFADVRNASNARGTFTFTGSATLNPADANNPFAARAPFADFLLGYAQQTSIQFGAEDYQFRANSWDLFVQDNWRVGKNLSWQLGLRYEYVTPYAELNNQLANLDVATGFSAVAVVLPGQTGPLTGQKYPSALIKPDTNNFAPRVGVAWKPFSKTVVRAGYGINYNLAQYGLMSTQLGFQPPFANAQINPATSPTSLTLQNGFPFTPASPDHITNTYAVDPNYTMAYVQAWNLNIQQEVKTSWVINIGYSGSKGTHLDMLRAPDQLQTGGPRFLPCTLLTPLNTPCVSPFLYESSEGSSILHAGTVRVRKRMRRGLSVGGTYTYSKSIDNASSIGGGTGVVAQNDLDIAAERGLSSFDQRHRFTADYSYTLPFGKDQRWLKGGWAGNLFGGFFVSGNMIVASGTPLSPRIFAGASDLSRGVSGSLRPDVVPGQSISLSDPSVAEWFNIHAFTAPAGVFGDAGRNTITGPGTLSFDMSLSKNVQLKEMQAMEFRLSASNVFNMVHYASVDTTLGSPTFGQVIAVGPMRRVTLTTRYRF
jgi:outer membrane receptor protein involved in Fe transport